MINTYDGNKIHALYIAHDSSHNLVQDNRFRNSTGDPIRLRDYSNYNLIRRNKLTRMGAKAGYTEWYCDHDVRSDCTKQDPECPSWANEFRDNMLDGTWACSTLLTFFMYQDEKPSCQPPGAGVVRLRTSGNTKSASPCSLM